jgi:hypothetical protein
VKVGDLVTAKHVKGLIGIIMSEIPTMTGERVYEVFMSDPGEYWDIQWIGHPRPPSQQFGRSQLVNIQI